MWKTKYDVFEKHIFLKKVAAWRCLHTDQMHEYERFMSFSNRIFQLAATLKSVEVVINDGELALAMLNYLRKRFYPLISALDVLGDEKTFAFEFVKSRPRQEEH